MEKQYKTELHCHSNPVSQCADVTADWIVEKYLSEGYSTVHLTNHLNGSSFAGSRLPTWKEKIDLFMEGYDDLKKAAEGTGLNILLGAEVSLYAFPNDFLCFGVTEEFLYEEDFLPWGLREFVEHAHKHGVLVYGAHPFRPGQVLMQQNWLDGFEVYNGHFGWNSSNHIAKMWAAAGGKPGTSGTDYHHKEQPVTAGIITSEEIKDTDTLVRILKSGEYSLIEELGKK